MTTAQIRIRQTQRPRITPHSRGNIARFTLLFAFGLLMVFPFWYMVVVSLSPNTASLQYPPTVLPLQPTLSNYVGAWTEGGFGGDVLRSAYVSVASTILGTGVGCMLAFAIARYRFPGRQAVFYSIIGSMMIPSMTFLLPQFDVMKSLGLLNSLNGLVLIYAAGSIPFTMFLMKGFFEDIPRELQEATEIDGGGRFVFFARIAMPLALPALVTVLLFNFMGGWEEFVMALTFLNDPNKFTMPIALMFFQNAHSTQWGDFFAAAVFQTIPLVAMFLIFQRKIIGTLGGAVRG